MQTASPATIAFHLTPSKASPHILREQTAPTAEFMRDLLELANDPPPRADKDGPALVPATFVHPQRRAEYVEAVTVFVLDVDMADAAAFDAWVTSLRQRGLWHLLYFTHSHGSKPGVCARAVFPLSHPVEVGTPSRWSEELWPRLVEHVGREVTADPQCRDCSRLYYLPSRRPDATPTPPICFEGAAIDVDTVLGTVPPVAPVTTPRRQVTEGGQDVSRDEIVRRLRRYKAAHLRPALQRATRGVSLGEPGARHEQILNLTRCLAREWREGESFEPFLSFADGSIAAMEEDEPGRDLRGELERGFFGALQKIDHWNETQRRRDAEEKTRWLANWGAGVAP